MSINITFACGHSDTFSEQMQVSPRCQCGEIQIIRVIPSRMPRFTGTVSGPFATYSRLEPGVVDVAPAGPLRIQEHGEE